MLRLSLVEFCAMVGTRMLQLATPFLVLAVTHSPTKAAIATVAELSPYVAFQLFGAGFASRAGLRKSCITGNCVASVAAASLSAAAVVHGNYAFILLACCMIGIGRGAVEVSAHALIPRVSRVGKSPLIRVTSVVEGSGRVATVIGAPAASLLLVVVPPSVVIGVTSVAFALAATWVLTMSRMPIEQAKDHGGSESVSEIVLGGLRSVFTDRPLRAIARTIFVINFADAGIMGFLIILWSQHAFGSAGPAGILLAVSSGAAVVGAATLATVTTKSKTWLTMVIVMALAGFPRFAVLVISHNLAVIIAVWIVSGVAAGMINPILGYVQFARVPEHRQAQVLGTINGICWAAIPLGALAAGVFVQQWGMDATLLILGSLYVIATVDILVAPSWRLLTGEPRSPSVDYVS